MLPRVIANPVAAAGRARRAWNAVEPDAVRALGQLDVAWTRAGGDAAHLASRAALDGCPLVIVVGGDGTVNEVVDALMATSSSAGARPALGVVMVGTGADLARTLELPASPAAQVERIASGRVRTLDVGRATFTTDQGAPQCRHFVNVGGFGLSGATDRVVNRQVLPWWLGSKLAFQLGVVQALARWRNVPVRLRVDGGDTTHLVVRVAAVANGCWFGGGMKIAPEAAPDDGVLDLVVVGDISALRLIARLPTVYRGAHLGFPEVSFVRARRVEAWPVDAVAVPIDLDGESPGLLPATFEVVPAALNVRL